SFFFRHPATSPIYTLSLHDALPIFGAFWISFWLLNAVFVTQVKPASALLPIIGTYLLAWGIFTAYMFLASLAGAKAVTSVFLFLDRKSTRLNSSHVKISYAVFCLKK